jgi:hypothetical protein
LGEVGLAFRKVLASDDRNLLDAAEAGHAVAENPPHSTISSIS